MDKETEEQVKLNSPDQVLSFDHNSKYIQKHEWKRVTLIITTNLMFFLVLLFNYLTSTLKITPNTVGQVSDLYYTDITPAGWAFSIWGFIYLYQAFWLGYSISCIFRKSRSGHYLYTRDFFHFSIFIAIISNFISNIGWIYVWSYSYLGCSLLLIIIMMVTLYIALIISFRKLKENEKELRNEGCTKDIYLTIVFVQNGIAFYATWISIASGLNFAVYIIWRLDVDIESAGTAALILILSAIVVYFFLENIIWPHYLLNIFTPWIVSIWALSGSLSKNWKIENSSRNNYITLVILIIVSTLAIFKIILIILYKTLLKNKFSRLKRVTY